MNILKLIVYIFLIFCFIPYIKVFNLGTNTDIQIYSLIFGVLIIFICIISKKIILPRKLIYYQIYFIYIVIILFLIYLLNLSNGEVEFSGYLRGIASYLFFIIIPIATFISMNFISEKALGIIIKIIYFIWVGVGIVQLFNPYFFTEWLGRKNITPDRGVISLANEPAYFSITLILLSVILVILNKDKNIKYTIFTLILSVFLAKSAVGLIYSLVLVFLLTANKNRVKRLSYLILIGVLILLGLTSFVNLKPDSRLSIIILSLIESPFEFIFSDDSLNIRFAHLFISFKYFITDFFLPHGVTTWGKLYLMELINNPDLFTYYDGSKNIIIQNDNSIVTMIGALLFELGILSIPYFIFIFKSFNKINNGKKVFLFILIMGLNGLNLTNPTFNFLLGFALYKTYKAKGIEK